MRLALMILLSSLMGVGFGPVATAAACASADQDWRADYEVQDSGLGFGRKEIALSAQTPGGTISLRCDGISASGGALSGNIFGCDVVAASTPKHRNYILNIFQISLLEPKLVLTRNTSPTGEISGSAASEYAELDCR
jgi:hypothetical protein